MAVFIENEAAYEAAIDRRIATNRVIGGKRRFFAAHSDAQTLVNFLDGRVSNKQIVYFTNGGEKLPDANFIDACWYSLQVFGGLTEKQAEAVRRVIAKQAERRVIAKAADALSEHVGEVGQRTNFELILSFYTSFDGTFGTTHIHGLKDAAGNVFIYKGTKKLGIERGEQIKLKATIKEHGIRDGVKQTILSRPA